MLYMATIPSLFCGGQLLFPAQLAESWSPFLPPCTAYALVFVALFEVVGCSIPSGRRFFIEFCRYNLTRYCW